MIRLWVTEIKAIDPATGFMKTWRGPNVPGISHDDAIRFCQQNELGYCRVIGDLAAEIQCKEGTHEPDMNKMADYEKINNN